MLSNELFYVFYSSLVTLDSALLLLTQTPETFTYDPVGNRETSADYSDWDYNSRNQLTGFFGLTYEYDDNGNTIHLLWVGTVYFTYTYNYENRLTRVDFLEGGYAAYKYDPAGRRIEKDVDGVVTKYLYDGDRLLAEYDSTDQLARNYFYGSGDINPTILSESGSVYYYYHDHLSTPQAITDENGTVEWQATYKAFGEVDITTENIVSNFRFPGQYYDDETKFYYNYHRYYNPGTGRYLRSDPIGMEGGNNYYVYALNNPIILSDSKGLFCDKCDDCPVGGYKYSGIEYGGFFAVAGIITRHLNFKCFKGEDSFSLTMQCYNFGLGLGGAISGTGGIVSGCNKSEAIKNITGWSIFSNLSPPFIPVFSLGGGFNPSKPSGNTFFPISNADLSVGFGVERSAGLSNCRIIN